MRRAATLVIALALAVVAYPDETYEVILPTTEVAKLDLGRTQHNDDVCEAADLASGCNQSDACIGVDAPCAGSCSDAQAVTYGCRIYAGTPGDREKFVSDQMFAEALSSYQSIQAARDKQAMVEWCVGKTLVQVNSLCNAIGLGPGCHICGVPPES